MLGNTTGTDNRIVDASGSGRAMHTEPVVRSEVARSLRSRLPSTYRSVPQAARGTQNFVIVSMLIGLLATFGLLAGLSYVAPHYNMCPGYHRVCAQPAHFGRTLPPTK